MLKQVINDFDFRKAKEEATVITELVFDQLGLPELKKLTVVEFNNRFTNRAGDAKLDKSVRWSGIPGSPTNDIYKGKIRLGSKYFAVASEQDRLDTVVHEACHIANKYLYYTNSNWRNFVHNSKIAKDTEGHGPDWEQLMIKVGHKPNRFHCTPTYQFKNYYTYQCPTCKKDWRLTIHMGNKLIRRERGAICNCKARFNIALLHKVSGSELMYGEA